MSLFRVCKCVCAGLLLMSSTLGGVSAQSEITARFQAPLGVSKRVIDNFNQASALYTSGNFQEASGKFQQICKDAPAFTEARLMYGTCLLAAGQPEAALEELRKVEAVLPNHEILLVNLAQAYRYLGQNEQSLEKYKKVLKLYPSSVHAPMIKDSLSMLELEVLRTKGTSVSKGQDNYLEEAVAMGAARWSPSLMPITVFIDSGNGIKGYRSEFSNLLKQAFVSWSDATEGKLSFEFVSNPEEALIACEWTDNPNQFTNPAEDGQALPMIDRDGNMQKSKVLILTTDRKGKHESISDERMSDLCLHEAGHALGLLGHSSDQRDIMFSVFSVSPRGELSNRDKKTILDLYSAPDSLIADHPVVLDKFAVVDNTKNPLNKAIRLNAEANAELESGNYLKAISKLEEAAKLSPDTEMIALSLANVYAGLGFKQLTAGDKASAEASFNQSAEYYKKGKRKDLAVKAYNKLIEMSETAGRADSVGKYQQLKRAIE